MSKFKFSKRAYMEKIKERRDWEGGGEEPSGLPDVSKKMDCIRFVSLDRLQKGTISVEIKAGKCDSSYMCSAKCNFR